MRRLALTFALVAMPALAQVSRITEADVRAFVAAQEQAWNAQAFDRYFAGFTAQARFTDQAYVGQDKPPAPYGTSTLAEARAQARRSAARSRELTEVLRVRIAADGQSATVTSRVGSIVVRDGVSRRLCAGRVQTLTLAGGRLRASGQTDTYVNCRGG